MSQDEISQVLEALQQQIHDLQNENMTVGATASEYDSNVRFCLTLVMTSCAHLIALTYSFVVILKKLELAIKTLPTTMTILKRYQQFETNNSKKPLSLYELTDSLWIIRNITHYLKKIVLIAIPKLEWKTSSIT